jgi:hypothetical protein
MRKAKVTVATEDPAVRILLAELATSAGEANEAWSLAVEAERNGDFDASLARLTDCETVLSEMVSFRTRTIAGIVRKLVKRYDEEAEDRITASPNSAS